VSQERWTAVDRYVNGLLLGPDPLMDAVQEACTAAGLPAIAVSPAQGKWLHLLARATGAQRILEIGTLGGYSAIWMARALPADGKLITLEVSPGHAGVAKQNIERAGLDAIVEVRVGPALAALERLRAEQAPPFDLVFIDADKPGYPNYLDLVLPLCRAGSLIVADNAVRDGAVADPDSNDANVRGIRAFIVKLAADPRLSGTILQTVGEKGYDGFAMALVTEPAPA